MRVAIGSDHAGFHLKETLKTCLSGLRYSVLDLGTYSTAPVDYPDFAEAVGLAVRQRDVPLLFKHVHRALVSSR